MNNYPYTWNSKLSRALACCCVTFALLASSAHRANAGVQMQLHLQHNPAGYGLFADLTTNAAPPAPEYGSYLLSTPDGEMNREFDYSGNDFVFSSGGSAGYASFDDLVFAITNGAWSLRVTNDTSTNFYSFNIQAGTLTSNLLPTVAITFPTDGATVPTNQPNFTWQGPTNFPGDIVAYDYDPTFSFFSLYLPYPPAATTTNWTGSDPLPVGTNTFFVQYTNSATAEMPISTPVNTNTLMALSGWDATVQVDVYDTVTFYVASTMRSVGHTLVAYYPFAEGNIFAWDYSGHFNDISTIGGSGGGDRYATNAPVVSDTFAAYFDNNGGSGAGYVKCPTNVLKALAGSFTVSLWVNTTQISGTDTDNGTYNNAGLVSAFNGAGNNWVIPMSLTGSKVAFVTGGSLASTLHSAADINTGGYVHVVVTRDQPTGKKKIYIDGVLDAEETASIDPLNTPTDLYIGANLGKGLQGTLDDIQIYQGALSSNEVAQLYANPGTAIPDVFGNGVAAHYDFDQGTELAPDVSGSGNDMVVASSFSGGGPVINTNAIEGAGSIALDGGSFLSPPLGLVSALAGNFSVSVWINTVQDTVISESGNLDAAGIVAADIPGDHNDVVPVAMDAAGEIVFNTGNPDSGDEEMYSWTTVNDGDWHHIVVTRDQLTGEKNIFVDGVLDAGSPEFGTTSFLNDPLLLTIGALADASIDYPWDPEVSGDNGFEGLIDDLQIYPRVLSSNDVAHLFVNPGATLIASNVVVPVAAEFEISIVRDQSFGMGDVYYCFPRLLSVNVPEITEHRVESPTGLFSGTSPAGASPGGSSTILSSLDSLMEECTNGLWKFYVNKDDPGQQVFAFRVMISGFDTNLLQEVTITSPTNGNPYVPLDPAFTWSGPVGFNGIFAQTYHVDPLGFLITTNLPGTATNWPSAPGLHVGMNRLYLSFHTNNVPFVTATVPANAFGSISNWTTTAHLNSDASSEFLVLAPPNPVQLLNVQHGGGTIQFSCLTEFGHPNTIESRTNLTVGQWTVLTNFVGSGTVQQFVFPATNPPARFFRVKTE